MQARLQNFLGNFSLPAVPLALAVLFWPFLDELDPVHRIWLERAPWLIAVCAALLAWRFHRSRLAMSLLVVLAILPVYGFPPRLLAVLVPLNILLLSLSSQAEVLWFFLLVVEGLTLHWLSGKSQNGLLHLWEALTVAPIPLLVSCLGLGWLVWKAFKSSAPLDGAQLAVMSGALAGMASGQAAPLWAAAVGLSVLLALVQHTYRMAYLDELTELPGRRALNEELSCLRGIYVIAMVDVDHFKKFNDTYGHDVGDQVLRLVASRLRQSGGGGRVFRYGGEEFTIVFPGRTIDEAWEHLNELRLTIENSPMTIRSPNRPRKKPTHLPRGKSRGQTVSITVSIGVAERSNKEPTSERVVKAADKALYRAKRNGRNQVAS